MLLCLNINLIGPNSPLGTMSEHNSKKVLSHEEDIMRAFMYGRFLKALLHSSAFKFYSDNLKHNRESIIKILKRGNGVIVDELKERNEIDELLFVKNAIKLRKSIPKLVIHHESQIEKKVLIFDIDGTITADSLKNIKTFYFVMNVIKHAKLLGFPIYIVTARGGSKEYSCFNDGDGKIKYSALIKKRDSHLIPKEIYDEINIDNLIKTDKVYCNKYEINDDDFENGIKNVAKNFSPTTFKKIKKNDSNLYRGIVKMKQITQIKKKEKLKDFNQIIFFDDSPDNYDIWKEYFNDKVIKNIHYIKGQKYVFDTSESLMKTIVFLYPYIKDDIKSLEKIITNYCKKII